MSTLGSLHAHQTSGEHTAAATIQGASMVEIVQQQLALLEALATEAQAEAAALQSEVADLSARLSAVIPRVAKLETMLGNHTRVLSAVRAGLQEAASRTSSTQPAPLPRQDNGTTQPQEVVAPPTVPAVQQVESDPTPSAHAAPSQTAMPTRPSQTPVAPARPLAQPEAQPSALPVRAFEQVVVPQPVQEERVPPEPIAPQAAPAAPAVDDGRPRVQRGSTVEVAFEDGSTEIYTLVRPAEANLGKGLIGDNSPLGMALLGAGVGDVRAYRVRATSPELSVRVRSIA